MFDEDVAQAPTRDGFGHGLVAAGDASADVVALCADLMESTRVMAFVEKYPNDFSSSASPNRTWRRSPRGSASPARSHSSRPTPHFPRSQLGTDPHHDRVQQRECKIAGHHAGISVGPDGATHQATEDIAIMRAMPNMKVIVRATPWRRAGDARRRAGLRPDIFAFPAREDASHDDGRDAIHSRQSGNILAIQKAGGADHRLRWSRL